MIQKNAGLTFVNPFRECASLTHPARPHCVSRWQTNINEKKLEKKETKNSTETPCRVIFFGIFCDRAREARV